MPRSAGATMSLRAAKLTKEANRYATTSRSLQPTLHLHRVVGQDAYPRSATAHHTKVRNQGEPATSRVEGTSEIKKREPTSRYAQAHSSPKEVPGAGAVLLMWITVFETRTAPPRSLHEPRRATRAASVQRSVAPESILDEKVGPNECTRADINLVLQV